MIRLENVKMAYGDRTVYDDISMTIEDGEVLGIIGPSGCGKSTLLRNILMLTPPVSGRIFIDDTEITAGGENVTEARKKIGMVFQNFGLFQKYTILENVAKGLVDIKKMDGKQAFDKAMDCLSMVGLRDYAYRYPEELSGGQQQRAAIARTVAMEPDVILMDEPTSALDPAMVGEVEAVIRMLVSMKKTLVIVSHELDLISSMCTRVIFLNNGEIADEGTVKEIFGESAKTYTRRFINGLMIMKFDIECKSFDFIGMQTTINTFAYKNGVPEEVKDKLQTVMEELCQMIVIQPDPGNHLHCSYEYDRSEKSVSGHIKFTGPRLDETSVEYMLSWPIIKMNTSELSYEEIDKKGYSNKISLLIK